MHSGYDETGVVVSQPDLRSQFDPERRQLPPSPHKKQSKFSLVIALVILVGAAGGLAVAYKGRAAAQEETKEAKAATKAALKRAADAERDSTAILGKLANAEKKLAISEAKRDVVEEVVKQKQVVANELESKLKDLLGEGEGEVSKDANGRLTLKLVDKILFSSGKAELTKSGLRVMARVGKALAEMDDKQVWVQGHTDKVPLKKNNEEFPSNWELSAARALSVVHFLQDVSKVDPGRLAAAAFSSYRPVSRRRKAKNRRIEIVLFPLDVKLRR